MEVSDNFAPLVIYGTVWDFAAQGAPTPIEDVYQAPELIECSDGKKRTVGEKAAWEERMWSAIKDAATS